MGSDFSRNPKLGLSIGKGREDCKSVSIFHQHTNPGPGEYNLQKEGENIKNMTMSQKLTFPSVWSASISPGPGACSYWLMQMMWRRLIVMVFV